MISDVLAPAQVEALRGARKRWNILYGATRSGKTYVSFFLAALHLREHYNDGCLFVGKTVNTIDRNVFDPMRSIFGREHVGEIVGKKEISLFGKRCYVVGANDERAITKIQGLGLGYAYCDELTTYPENFFQMLKSRLDAPGACCDATCNPEAPSHYVKHFIDTTDPEWIYSRKFTIYDNNYLDPDFVRALESEYRGTVYFDKWILGEWTKAEGLVFPLFRRERHYLTPEAFARSHGRATIRTILFGVDGANTNDATAIVPVAILDDGRAVVLECFYHNPRRAGQLSNEQLVPLMMRYFREMEERYGYDVNRITLWTAVDCAAADLCLTLGYHLPEKYHVTRYTDKRIGATTDTVNNAFSRGVVTILDFGGLYDYARGRFEKGEHQLVIDLESMTWDEGGEKYDPKIPNDCADAFRYALCAYYQNPGNLWEVPAEDRRFEE